jgi:hypothetical protein
LRPAKFLGGDAVAGSLLNSPSNLARVFRVIAESGVEHGKITIKTY